MVSEIQWPLVPVLFLLLLKHIPTILGYMVSNACILKNIAEQTQSSLANNLSKNYFAHFLFFLNKIFCYLKQSKQKHIFWRRFFFTILTCKKKGRKTDFWSTCHHQDLKVSMMLFPIARNVKTNKKSKAKVTQQPAPLPEKST